MKVVVYKAWSNPDAKFIPQIEVDDIVPYSELKRHFRKTYNLVKELVGQGRVVEISKDGELTSVGWIIVPAKKVANKKTIPALAGRMQQVIDKREMIEHDTVAEPVYEGSLYRFLLVLRHRYA